MSQKISSSVIFYLQLIERHRSALCTSGGCYNHRIMSRNILLARLHEYTLFVTTAATTTELMHYYAVQGNAADAKLLASFLYELAHDRRDRLDEFDEALQQEKMDLLNDEKLPLLLKYYKAKARMNALVNNSPDDSVLGADSLNL